MNTLITQASVSREYARLCAIDSGYAKYSDVTPFVSRSWIEQGDERIRVDEFTDEERKMSLDDFSDEFIKPMVCRDED